ncbi:enoyl-CoA hydratase [Pseudoroseomonas rhizosphaerae]|uniref:Enoyl-CoA hydratase n=1 Tax=Teichococcus rhizosphaerae TaxID=1335062 RepID=A0A2C7A9N7_9PROT|nr:enoyl-CoA hydratase/isomerase family protein [Pseudoroseomonas rhizosphaerae]PHK94353.1 enoyl-CoA hydratase [Pseudoroseomonas rhizosphaerae]
MFEVERREGVVVMTMNRAPANAISEEFLAGFNRVLDGIEREGLPRALHIRSALRFFSAGADLKEIGGRFGAEDGVRDMLRHVAAFHHLYDRIERLPLVTIAEINGPALGGGLELALSCDLRIAAQEARIGLPEAGIGLIPGAGGTQRLTRLCGPGVAARIILANDMVDGATAERLGIVQWAVPGAELPARARALADQVAGLAGPALAACKACIRASTDRAPDGYAMEHDATRRLMTTEEARKRVSAFLESRRK